MKNSAKLYVFVVRGKGPFPFDMLRYDSCWPVDGAIFFGFGMPGDPYYGERSIELRSHTMPTEDRWASFGWNVIGLGE